MTDRNPPGMPPSGTPVEAVIGITVILAAVVAALVVAIPAHQEEVPATWIDDAGQVHYGLMQDCGSALAPTGACPNLIRGKQYLAGGVTALGALLGIGLIIAGYQERREKPPPPAVTHHRPTT